MVVKKETVKSMGSLATKTMDVTLKGVSPIILNAMSAKTKQGLLLPAKQKTKADKEQHMKHEVLKEFIDSCYRATDDNAPTRVLFPVCGIKTALMNAALEVPGAKKQQIARLIWTEGDYISVYGKPEMLMSVVRTADLKHTPDIRTRAIIREWVCSFRLTYVTPTLTETDIRKLLEAAGLIMGLGDFRQEKGKGSYGRFCIATPEETAAIIKEGGLKTQDKAFASPVFYDKETEELYSWYVHEKKARGR